MRERPRRFCVGPSPLWLLLALPVVACAAGRYPSSSVARPLTMPMAEDQLVAWGVGGVPLNRGTYPVNGSASMRYRVGITDEVEYRFPLSFAYRWYDEEAGAQIAISGGAVSLGLGGLSTGDVFFMVDPMVALSGKVALAEGHALTCALVNRYNLVLPGGLRAATGEALCAWSFDATEWLTFSVPVSGSYTWREYATDRIAVTVGGFASDGYAPIPVFSFHVIDWLDIIASPGATYLARKERFRGIFFAGVDLHWF